MYLKVFPTVSQITLMIVETNKPPFVEYTKPSRRLIIVFMNFRQSSFKVELLMINGVIER